MKNTIKYKKGQPSMITFIKKRCLKDNLNFICLFKGATGQGKTYAGMSMAYQIDPTFDAEKQITFSFRETMQLANDPEFRKRPIKIILWDEPQVTISNRSWQGEVNKMTNYFLSTFRHANIILIFCSPYQDFLDSQTVKLLHCVFECQGWSKRTKLSRVRPRLEQYNSDLKKIYHHSLYVLRYGRLNRMPYWDIKIPPQNLIDIYEKKKTEFTSKLNLEIQNKMDKLENKKEEAPVDEWHHAMNGHKAPTLRGLDILNCWKRGIFNQKEIAEEIGSVRDLVSKAEVTLRKGGWRKEIAQGLWVDAEKVNDVQGSGGNG